MFLYVDDFTVSPCFLSRYPRIKFISSSASSSVSNPSYFGQIMVATNPHIGNYGVNANEVEADKIMISGLVCKNFSFTHSRPDSESNLYDYFEKQNLICISDVDTRALVSYIRDNGAQNAVICTDGTPVEELKSLLAKVPDMKGLELASTVSVTEPYFFGDETLVTKLPLST